MCMCEFVYSCLYVYVYHSGLEDNCLVSYITTIYSNIPLAYVKYLYILRFITYGYLCVHCLYKFVHIFFVSLRLYEVYSDFVWVVS